MTVVDGSIYCVTICVDIHSSRFSHPCKTINLLLKTDVLFRVIVFLFHDSVIFVSLA